MNKLPDSDLLRSQFDDDFLWGVSTAAFQIEGAHDSDGKGLSIWDVFTNRKNRIKGGQRVGMACDFYNRYQSDVQLISDLNIPNFRFSISWSRILPFGEGAVNQAGIDYYNNLINSLLDKGIEPWVTLYHWDLPQALEDRGGWTNRDVVLWLSNYAQICATHFGDRVKKWMVVNEPSVFTGAGYFLGIHAPGKRGINNYLKAIHHVTLATTAAAKVLRKEVANAAIGTTFSCTYIQSATSSERDQAAAKRVDTLLNRTFIEPILGLGYPLNDLPVLKKMQKYMHPEDAENLSFDFDFIGIQCYTREVVKASYLTPYIGATLVSAKKRKMPTTEMGWEVYPESIYEMIKRFNSYEGIRQLIITENGSSFPDTVFEGEVHDEKRVQYLRDHLRHVLLAKKQGYKLDGYFVWTLTDNFEWAEGYHPRFGLIHVNFETQERIVKTSGKWYRDFLSENIL